MKTLVIGATGLVGLEVCRRLREAGATVRALIRTTADAQKRAELERLGIELAEGDLKDPASLARACAGVQSVISTASSTLARQSGDSIETVDRRGQLALVDAARAAGVEHFVFVSFRDKPAIRYPLTEAKREVEEALKKSGMAYTILQASYFMEVWLTPALGFDAANGEVRIYGDGSQPISWISYKDVARAAAAAVAEPASRNRVMELGGPQALSAREVVRMFEAAGAGEIATENGSCIGARGADERRHRSARENVCRPDAAVHGRRFNRSGREQPAVPVSNDIGPRLHRRPVGEGVTAMAGQSPIVLVHGAFQSAATWDLVAPRLKQGGRPVFVARLTGLGPDAGPLSESVSLDTHIRDVVDLLQRHDLRDVVLVGHSYGGMIVTGAAEHARDRIGHLVYVDALVPEHGQSALDIMTAAMADTFRQMAAAGGGWRMRPSAKLVEKWGLEEGPAREFVEARLCDFTMRCFDQPLEAPARCGCRAAAHLYRERQGGLSGEGSLRALRRACAARRMGLPRAADRPRLPGGDARRVERAVAAHGSLLTPERAFAAVVERGIAGAVQARANDVESTSNPGAGNVIEEEHGAALAAGYEIDLEPELVVMNHDWLRAGDRA